MITTKKYGAYGLLELTIEISIGKQKKSIQFTGGCQSMWGVDPATYTTSNAIIQYAIERSEAFKSGKVKILKQITTKEPSDYEAEKKVAEEKVADGANEGSADGMSGVVEVKVACLQDAVDYLKEKFGTRNLRGKASVEKVAKENGIVFIGI